MTGYYDIILGLIPLSLAGVTGSLHLAGVETIVAVPAAATVAVALIGHAMFVNGPVDSAPSDSQSQRHSQSYSQSQLQSQSQPNSPASSNAPQFNSAD